ncbi:SIR2 family protein [Chloroflexota bacterium]
MLRKSLKVVYLFGTGASQAEASIADDTINLLMDGIREGILEKIINEKKGKKLRAILVNELTSENVDVEQLISLYDSSGNKRDASLARVLKKYFKEGILEQIQRLDGAGYFKPKLYTALLDMHEIKELEESLTGIMTLNYEDLIERAVQQVHGDVDFSFTVDCKSNSRIQTNGKFILLKLHGSFNWKREFPVTLQDKIRNDEDILWIPPGVEKRHEQYPFNIIWGKAQEILNCDILRIVGCSLSHNDWHLVSLLYSTQKLNKNGKQYRIEVINRPAPLAQETRPAYGEGDIKKKYPHLRIYHIHELEEMRYLVQTSLYKGSDGVSNKVDAKTITAFLEKQNVFMMWLKAKGEYLIKNRIPITTPKGIFRNFMEDKENEDNT